MLIKIFFSLVLFFFSISGLFCEEGKLSVITKKANNYGESVIKSFIIETTEKRNLLTPSQNGEIQTKASTSRKAEPKIEKEMEPKPAKERNRCIKVGASYFSPSEKSFKDIYGGGMAIGGEINIKLWKFIDLWLLGNYYSRKGSLPFTKEETRMRLLPIGGGVKVRFQKGVISPYIGFGPVIYIYKETNPIGIAKGTNAGIMGQAGCYFNIVSGLLFDVSINYTYCRVKPQKIKANLGGIQAGIGLGYMF